MDQPGVVQVIATGFVSYGRGFDYAGTRLVVNGGIVSEYAVDVAYTTVAHGYSFWAPAGAHSVALYFTGVANKNRLHYASICLIGAKR